jgi:hypothetical protein
VCGPVLLHRGLLLFRCASSPVLGCEDHVLRVCMFRCVSSSAVDGGSRCGSFMMCPEAQVAFAGLVVAYARWVLGARALPSWGAIFAVTAVGLSLQVVLGHWILMPNNGMW